MIDTQNNMIEKFKQLCCILVILCCSVVRAEENPKSENGNNKQLEVKHVWLDLKAGISSIGGIAVGAKLNTVLSNDILMSLEVTEAVGICIFCGYSEKVSEKNLLVGMWKGSGAFYGYAQIGLGSVSGVKRGKLKDNESSFWESVNDQEDPFSTIGVPINLGFGVAKYVGMGLDFHMNINSEYPVVGLSLNIAIGKLNPSSRLVAKNDPND